MTSSLGWVDLKTDQLSAEAKMLLDSEAAIKRFGTPEEIANVALLLSSNEGSYITGQSYVVDVGLWYG